MASNPRLHERSPSTRPNPFGYADHAPFTGFRSELVWGELPEGTFVHVKAARRGKACGCRCPACGEMLIAYQGTVKVAYFGHQRGGATGCGTGAETNAHVWAKEVLGREKRLLLPAVEARSGKRTRTDYRARMFKFEHARLEKRLGDLVPDVVLTDRGGREVIVEVCVTHACGDEKKAKLRAEGWTAVEVHLGHLRRSDDRTAIERALLVDAPREWLFNRKQDGAQASLDQELRDEAQRETEQLRRRRKAAAAAERRAAEQERLRVTEQAEKLLSAAKRARYSVANDPSPLEDKRDPFAAPTTDRSCFGFVTSTAEWQKTLFRRCIDDPELSHGPISGVRLAQAAAGLEDCIDPAFLHEPTPAVLAAMRSLGLTGEHPHAAIETYFHDLVQEGLLICRGEGSFDFSPEHATSLRQRLLTAQDQARRICAVDHAMAAIVASFDNYERAVFDADAWRTSPLPGSPLDLASLVEQGGSEWERLDQALLAIERMLKGGPPVPETLGLPLASLVNTAVDREAAAIAIARAKRRSVLQGRAVTLLGPEAFSWLGAENEDAVSSIERAEHDDAGLDRMMARLEQAGRERAERLRANDLAWKSQTRLEAAAKAQLGHERADLFLRNHEPLPGEAPATYCVDDFTLGRCLKVLADRQAGSRSRLRR